ncbi:MAG: 50S ribosomal protein L5 [Candidatus Gracilibacteria bacterium]
MATRKTKNHGETIEMLKKELGRKNLLSLPRVMKVSVSCGIGSMITQGNKDYAFIEKSLAEITGQKPALRKSRKAISNFKLRKGLPVGLVVTLRKERMFDFLGRLVNIALPRVRDFHGISVKGFDGQGNYSLGIEDCTIFPEVDQETLTRSHGLQVNVSTKANNNREGYLLLKAMGFPFKEVINEDGKIVKKS